MSDTHGRHIAARQAVQRFDAAGVEHIIHCGDVGGVEVFEELTGKAITFVWGNTDDPDIGLNTFLQSAGFTLPTAVPTVVELDHKRFAVFHGHEHAFYANARSPGVDYVLHGHTHETRDDRVGEVRFINPGALHRARVHTVAILDTDSDRLEFVEIGSR